MARTLNIWRTAGGAYTDYTAWLHSPAGRPVFKRMHGLNQPQTLEFYLTDGVTSFVAPEAGNRVQVITDTFPNYFTGYIVNIPKRERMGTNSAGSPIHQYFCKCIDESLRLEWASATIFPTLAPFVSKTQGAILKELIGLLTTGIGTSNVANGITIPYFRVKPEEGFWEVVRRLSDNTNMAFRITAAEAYYEAFDATAFGYGPTQTDTQFDPEALAVSPIDNPVFNDVVGLGGAEAQSFVREYFVGDGFNGSFPLKLPVYGAESSKLLEDDFSGTSINSGTWTETDPTGILAVSGNSLVLAGGPSASNHRLTATQLLEIAGSIVLRAGRIRFNAASNCIIGGVFSADTGLIADCVAGFKASVNGSTTRLQAIVSGAVAGPTFDVVTGKTYQFVLTVNCSEQSRLRRSYFSALGNTYAGGSVAANATVSFAVTELPNSESDNPTRVLDYSDTVASIDQFLYYTLLSYGHASDSVNLRANFCLLRRAVQVELWTKKITDADYVQRALGDKADPEAVAALTVGTEGNELSFFADRIPEAQELIRVFYREAGIARARVRLDSSITSEASKSGGTGVKAGYLGTVTPTPRDSVELELALQAFIDDHTTQFYEGSWKFNSKSYTYSTEPLPGRIITVNVPAMYSSFDALVTVVTLELLLINKEDSAEIFQATAQFGPLRRDQAEALLPPEEALTGPDDRVVQLDSVEFNDVGATHAADVPDAVYDGTKTATTFEIDAGRAPTDAFEIRATHGAANTDSLVNFISWAYAQTFTVPRASRDLVLFMRDSEVDGTKAAFQADAFQSDAFQELVAPGTSIVSRFPTVIRIAYPLTPLPPAVTVNTDDPFVSHIALDISATPDDVFGVEIRDSDDATVLYSYEDILLAVQPDHPGLKYDFPVPDGLATNTLYARTFNLLGEYSGATATSFTTVKGTEYVVPSTVAKTESSTGGGTAGVVTSEANAIDGDIETYATLTGATTGAGETSIASIQVTPTPTGSLPSQFVNWFIRIIADVPINTSAGTNGDLAYAISYYNADNPGGTFVFMDFIAVGTLETTGKKTVEVPLSSAFDITKLRINVGVTAHQDNQIQCRCYAAQLVATR